jgi:hypothetical protein
MVYRTPCDLVTPVTGVVIPVIGLVVSGTGAPPPGVIECCMGGLHSPVLAGLLYPADEPGLGAFL